MQLTIRTVAALAILGCLLTPPMACDDSSKPEPESFDGDAADLDEEMLITEDLENDSAEESEDEADLEGEGSETTSAWTLPYGDPTAMGPYRVGAIAVRFVNTDHTRDVSGVIWYPTDAVSGESFYYQDIFMRENVLDSPDVAAGGPFPVALFSHGNQGFCEQSYYMTEYLASHGFIVASPDHIGNTTGTFDAALWPYIAQQRPRDLSMAIDYLEAANTDAASRFHGKAEFDHIAAIGHSFGGFTVLYIGGATPHKAYWETACAALEEGEYDYGCEIVKNDPNGDFDWDAGARDPRIKAIVPQTAAGFKIFSPEGIAAISIPVLVQSGDADKTVSHAGESVAIYAPLNPPKAFLTLKGAGHFTYSNMCDLMPGYGDGCGKDYLDWNAAVPLIRVTALAFIRTTLWQESRDAIYLTQEYARTFDFVTFQSSGLLFLPNSGDTR